MEFSAVEIVWWHYLALFVTGIFVGINNVLAGGGSLISMPMLIFLGLDSADANGTNRLAIAIQNVFAVSGFKKKGIGNWRFGLQMTFPAIPGAVLGVFTAVTISDMWFRRVLSMVMVLVLVLILARRSGHGSDKITPATLTPRQKYGAMLAFAGIGFYVGFIQAGVGFIIIGTLAWITGMDLVQINAYKVFIIGVLTWIAVVLFAISGHIVLSLGLVLAAGNGIGGWLGSSVAVKGGEIWIKRILVVAVLVMALKLSGIVEVIIDLI